MGHHKKSKYYRKDLEERAKLPEVKVRARIAHVQNGQVCLRDIELLDHYNYFGDQIDFKEHMWVPAKPFDDVINNHPEEDIVDFVGIIYQYKNKKGETNYSIKKIQNVKRPQDVLAEVILVGAGLQTTEDAVARILEKPTEFERCQDVYNEIVEGLSENAEKLFVFVHKLHQFNLAHDRTNYKSN